MRRTVCLSYFESSLRALSSRFFFPDLTSRLWRRPEGWKSTLPLGVTRKRLVAARFDFILGMASGAGRRDGLGGRLWRAGHVPFLGPAVRSPVLRPARGGGGGLHRSQHHNHVPPVEVRTGFDDAEVLHLLGELVEDALAELRVDDLAPAEHDRDLDLVPLPQEPHDVALLGLVVVRADLRAELNLLDGDRLLVLARLLGLLLLVVAPLAVVHDPAHRRPGVRRH